MRALLFFTRFFFHALRLTLCVTLYGIAECINVEFFFEMREIPTDFGHIYTIFYLACPCACYFPLSLSPSFRCDFFVKFLSFREFFFWYLANTYPNDNRDDDYFLDFIFAILVTVQRGTKNLAKMRFDMEEMSFVCVCVCLCAHINIIFFFRTFQAAKLINMIGVVVVYS